MTTQIPGQTSTTPLTDKRITISLVKDATDILTRDARAHGVIKAVRSGKWRQPVERIRTEFSDVLKKCGRKAAKEAVADAKKQLPGALWSGRFSSRKKPAGEKLLLHSGLLCTDLDDLGERLAEIRAKVATSPYLFGLFTSPTGHGLKAILRVRADAAEHVASFRAAHHHIYELTGAEIDQSCCDVARLCFVSYDPDAVLNTNAAELPPLPQESEAQRHEFAMALPEIGSRRQIATELLGEIQWDTDTHGFCQCPGKHLHETSNGTRDCELHLNRVPTVYCFHNHCGDIITGTNHELRSRIAKAERIDQTRSTSIVAESVVWKEPKVLPADLPTVPPFNFDCLPATLRPWIEDIADRMQCPPDFPAVGATVGLSSLVGRKICIRPKRHDDWPVVGNLWGGVVGRPGVMKSPALEQALLPLRRLAGKAFEEYEAALTDYAIKKMLEKQRSELTKKKIATCLKKGDEQTAHNEAKAAVSDAAEVPVCRRYETNDPTIEKLGVLLVQNPNGLLLFRDELVGFLRVLDKEGHESNRATYLEMWNGTGSFVSDRIQRGTIRTPAILALLGGIQPDLLTAYVREAVRGGVGADGLLQRFQLAVWPDVSKNWRNIDRWPDTKAKNDAFTVFEYLDQLTPEVVGAETASEIPFLRFKADAQERFDYWRAELEKKLRSDAEHPAFEAHLSKYRKLVPALALLIHLANRDEDSVSLNALEKALLWATYLEAHARRIYSAVLCPDTASARELAKHLQRGDLSDRFTLRETYRKGWTGLTSKEDAEAATEILCDMGWIRVIPEFARTAGRPLSPSFEVNPKIREGSHTGLTEPTKLNSGSFVSDKSGGSEKFNGLKQPAPVVAEAVDI